MNIGTWSMRLRPRPTTIDLRLQVPERELLRAVLPWPPSHPRALVTLLEALALWQGDVLRVAVCVDGSSDSSGLTGLGLFGATLDDLGSPLVHAYEISPSRCFLRLRRRRPSSTGQWDLDLTGGEK
jgi:hypothetical protein